MVFATASIDGRRRFWTARGMSSWRRGRSSSESQSAPARTVLGWGILLEGVESGAFLAAFAAGLASLAFVMMGSSNGSTISVPFVMQSGRLTALLAHLRSRLSLRCHIDASQDESK